MAPKSRTQVVLMNKRLLMESRYPRQQEEKILKRILKDMEPLQQQLKKKMHEAEDAMKHRSSAVKVIFDYDSLFHRTARISPVSVIQDMIRTYNIQYSRFLNLYVKKS